MEQKEEYQLSIKPIENELCLTDIQEKEEIELTEIKLSYFYDPFINFSYDDYSHTPLTQKYGKFQKISQLYSAPNKISSFIRLNPHPQFVKSLKKIKPNFNRERKCLRNHYEPQIIFKQMLRNQNTCIIVENTEFNGTIDSFLNQTTESSNQSSGSDFKIGVK